MRKPASFSWRKVYLNFVRQFDPEAIDPGVTQVRFKRPYGWLSVAEHHLLDPRETNSRREIVKAIFKSPQGVIVLTTTEGLETGYIYYF